MQRFYVAFHHMDDISSIAAFTVSLVTGHAIQLVGTPPVSSQVLSVQGLRLTLGDMPLQRVIVGSQEMVGEETHISRDGARLNGKEKPLWAEGKLEGLRDLAYAQQALPNRAFSAWEPREQRQFLHNEEQRVGQIPPN